MLVIAQKWFQLGNRLFAMGHFIGAARAGGFSIANPAFEDYAAYFETTSQDLWCRYPARRSWLAGARGIPRALEKPAVWISGKQMKWHMNNRVLRAVAVGVNDEYRLDNPEFLRWAKRTLFLQVHGWSFRDPVNFERHAEEIRRYFTPIVSVRKQAADAVAAARREAEVLVGVHIRQGDYREHLGGKYFFETPRYADWMRQIAEQYSMGGQRVAFLVCSNVRQDPAHFAGLRWSVGPGQMVADMYALAQCDRIVGPPSTFSQWASFYGQRPLCIVRDPERGAQAREGWGPESFVVFNSTMSHV